MKFSSIKYLIGEGCKNVWVNRLMTIASVGVLTACMVLIGLAILVTLNVNKAVGELEKQNVIMVYLNDKNSVVYAGKEPILEKGEEFDVKNIKDSHYLIHNEEEAKAVCDSISKLSNVESVEYVSSEEGLESLKQESLEGQKELFMILDEENGNPLPAAARVQLKSMEEFNQTVKQINNIKGVSHIKSQGDLAETINSLKNGIGVAGIWIIAILLLISLVIVSNTIRVTMYNRKLQISIMKAVGATNTFIRVPFVVEGILIGIISAVFSECLVYFCYRVATETMFDAFSSGSVISFGSVALPLLGVFAGIGVLAGIFGSAIMIGKYLRKEGSEFAAI